MVVVRRPLFLRYGPNRPQKRPCRIGEGGLPSMNQPQHWLEFQFIDNDAHQFASLELMSNGEMRNECHSIPHCHESFDRLYRRKINAHVERRAISLERFDHLAP